MTRPKGEKPVSEKRPYSYACHTKRKDKCLDAVDIARLFRDVGWIGSQGVQQQ